ncbi:hypothetical protein HPB51_005704 [Rhipicephalus microplus]|uniref:Transposable element n=1 Tax=Rhipicephalus microplus TaxID=6941 RepID=A0A9J6EN07_RHIMP|nr:hypothetical protein HPB51_005704 [Rhipicephalus microplus]
MRTKNSQVRKPRPKSKCMKTLRRKVIRSTLKRERLSKELASMKKQLCNVTEAKIESVLHVLPAKQQLAFKTAVMAAKAKMKNGRRYDDEWLMTCLLLQISSPKAYTLISDMQLLPLPTKARLRQIISGIPCKYGYNEVALSTIKAHFQGKSHIRRCGVLLLDEIKLKQSVAFNKASCKMDGFVDYGDVTSTATDKLADHGLVFMFVPLFEDWVQPIASFATKGAAPGKVLSELVLSAVLELHKSNASVLAIISDGAGNNHSMWTQLGISGKLDSSCHHIEHPWEPSQRIYFICDVPHIIRCIRNHVKKHTYGLLFSRSTAVGLKLYREAKVPGMEDSEGTETFTRMVNDLFDALNIKLPSRGVRRHSKEIQILKDFLEMLNTTERNAVKENLKLFASQQTTESLRRHFGLARSFGGDESHPTVVNFSQIFRLLSLYTPIKTALRGSVQGTPCSVLVNVTDTLKITKDAHQEEKVRLHDIVEAKMMEITTASADTSEQGPSDHAYFKGEVEDSVVYYLCGYVIHKFTKHATCHLCIEDISSATPVLASDSYLTDYRSFKQGSLKHPTQKMLTFFKIVSKVVSACLDKEDLCGDIFWKVLEELEKHHLSRLGCDQHNSAFTCQLLNFFIITRMHFFSRDVNRRLGSSQKVAIANKKARLL